jgi:hypothetical protein
MAERFFNKEIRKLYLSEGQLTDVNLPPGGNL